MLERGIDPRGHGFGRADKNGRRRHRHRELGAAMVSLGGLGVGYLEGHVSHMANIDGLGNWGRCVAVS